MLDVRGRDRRPLRRRLGFVIGLALLVWLAVEVAALGLHVYANGHPYPKSRLKREMKAVRRGPAAEEPKVVDGGALAWERRDARLGDVVEEIHPYLGYVLDRGRNPFSVSDTGFMPAQGRSREGVPRRRDGVTIVGVFGGSFANGVGHQLEAVFERCDAFGGESIELRNVALGGYKQPQALLALAYLTSLGGEFDLVLNIDGFNEVALPLAENVAHGVHPQHPRLWHLRAGSVLAPERARALGRLELVRDFRDRWARLFLESRAYRSPALLLVWQLGDATASRRGRADEDLLATPWDDDARSGLVGPPWEGADLDDEAAIALLADHWVRASLGMRALAEAGGARYVHALQPNQYVEGSKPMTSPERATAIGKGSQANAARVGYPMLRARVAALRDAGVEALDLTGVFADETEPLYVDDCCHVSSRGYVLVAEAICDAL